MDRLDRHILHFRLMGLTIVEIAGLVDLSAKSVVWRLRRLRGY